MHPVIVIEWRDGDIWQTSYARDKWKSWVKKLFETNTIKSVFIKWPENNAANLAVF